jgi:hypothetical protein
MVDDLRKYFLARDAFARDKNGQVGRCHLTGYIDSPVEQRRISYDPKPLFDGLYIHGFYTDSPKQQGCFLTNCKINQNPGILQGQALNKFTV